MPERIQRKRTKGWRAPAGVVNCTRPSDWGNPFAVGEVFWVAPVDLTITPTLAVALFAAYVTQRGWIEQMTNELRGKDLMCYCPIGSPCHVDWILATVNA